MKQISPKDFQTRLSYEYQYEKFLLMRQMFFVLFI